MNSSNTYDSAIFVDSGEGFSGSVSGPPYAMAGTWHCTTRERRPFVYTDLLLTLLAGFTLGAYHSGLFCKSISKRL